MNLLSSLMSVFWNRFCVNSSGLMYGLGLFLVALCRLFSWWKHKYRRSGPAVVERKCSIGFGTWLSSLVLRLNIAAQLELSHMKKRNWDEEECKWGESEDREGEAVSSHFSLWTSVPLRLRFMMSSALFVFPTEIGRVRLQTVSFIYVFVLLIVSKN